MKKQWVLIVLALCLSLLGSTHPILAQDSNDTLARMQQEGWKIVKDGVLQREPRAGEVETFVFGVPGFTWKLQDLQNQLRNLQTALRSNPTPELRAAIANHRKEIASTRKMIALARLSESRGETGIEKVSCNISFAYNASATHHTSARGTWANATASFSSNCAFYGEVYAYAYANATVNGALTTHTVTDGPRSGANVSASAYATVNGVPACESYAYASMTSSSLNPSSYSMSAQNYNCPQVATPPTVTVTSDQASVIDLYYQDCVYINWTTNIYGGSSPYSTTMYWNNSSLGNRTTYSGWVCNQQINTTETLTIRSDVTDSASQFGSGSNTTTIRHHYYREPKPCTYCIEP
jgi:hypothetical protein